MDTFIALDFETANASRASLCSIGLAIYEDRHFIGSGHQYIKPHSSVGYFSPFNAKIHGISDADVSDSPEYWRAHDGLLELIGDKPIVSHNAAFDYSVLKKVTELYGVTFPQSVWIDTLSTGKRLFPKSVNHTLPMVASLVGHKITKHHNAEEDAIASAKIALSATLDDSYEPGRARKILDLNEDRWDLIDPSFDVNHPLNGHTVVFTGSISGLSRERCEELVEAVGGEVSSRVTKKTTVLIDNDPFTVSSKEKMALRYIEAGVPISIYSGEDFIHMFSVV